MEGWARVVLHVDMDAFFASAEQARRPELRGKPVIVGADPRGGTGRGVVTSASYEARAFGVRSAMPIARAWQLCPQAVYLRPDFAHYAAVSGRVMAALGAFADLLEPAGLDEAYVDATRRVGDLEDLEALARAIQAAVLEAAGLGCSVGAAQGKATAKIACEMGKPGGVTILPPSRAREALAPLPARAVPGIGPRTEERLRAAGLATIGDLAAAEPRQLERLLGSWAPFVRSVALGLEATPVAPREGPPRSVGAETTFAEDVAEPEVLGEELRGLAAEVAERLRAEGLAARTLTLKVRFEDFETHTRSRTLPYATRAPALLAEVALGLLEPFLADGRAVRLLGARASGLQRAGRQTTLDDWLPGRGGA